MQLTIMSKSTGQVSFQIPKTAQEILVCPDNGNVYYREKHNGDLIDAGKLTFVVDENGITGKRIPLKEVTLVDVQLK